MEIIVDARVLSENNPAGVARYTLSIVNELLKKGVTVRLISNRKIKIYPKKNYSGIFTIHEYVIFKYIPGTFFIIFIIPFIASMKGKIFWGANHAVPLFNTRSILTIHDLVVFDCPESMTLVNRISTTFAIIISILAAKKISTVSNFTRLKLYEKFKLIIKEGDVSVISNSVDREIFFIEKGTYNKYLNQDIKKYILGVGSLEPRKNLLNLIDAFIYLKDSGYDGHLILVGGRGWKLNSIYKKIEESNYQKYIHILGFIPDQYLNIFYNNCDVFVFPSWYEGFGLPALESIAAGANLLCSINTEIPYIFNKSDKITWFDPKFDKLNLKLKEALRNQLIENVEAIPSWENSSLNLMRLADFENS